MARDFINITTSTAATQAQELRNYCFQLRQAYETGLRVKAKMLHLNDGSTFTDLEAAFGLAPGKGQAVFDLVNGSVGAMEGTFQNNNAKTITEQVG